MTLTQHEWLDMFSALNSETRFNIMVLLHNEGEKNEAQISKLFDLNRRWFMVHINALMSAQLIDYTDRPTYDHWGITEKGKKVLEILS